MSAVTEDRSWEIPRVLKAAIVAGTAFCAWLIFGFDPLPIADLPQHVAQLALFRELGDPTFPFAGQYEINYFTPYLLAYLVAGFFALAMPLATAFKATIFTALLAFLFAIYRFQRRVGADPWWILLGFPLFFGLAFVWGFLNFMMAVPLVLLAVELSFGYGADPRWRTRPAGGPGRHRGLFRPWHGLRFRHVGGRRGGPARSGAWRTRGRCRGCWRPTCRPLSSPCCGGSSTGSCRWTSRGTGLSSGSACTGGCSATTWTPRR